MTVDDGFALPASTHVGRVALRVGSLDRVLPFYRDGIGFDVERADGRVDLRAGDRTVLVLIEDPDAPDRPDDAAGLFHVAVRVPSRGALGDVLDRAREYGESFTGASDHLVSEALYFRDPEGNGVEVYCDRPREEWPWDDDGGVNMDTLPLDLAALSAASAGGSALPDGTDVGHVHLEVTDVDRAESFYVDTLGFGVRDRYGPEATFVAAGDYHHHVGLNVWNRRQARAGDALGLSWFEVALPDDGTVAAVRRRLDDARVHRTDRGAFVVHDPDGVQIRLVVDD